MEINQWLNENLFEHKFNSENIFEISNLGKFYNLPEKDVVFDERLILQLEDEEHELLKTEKIDFISYKFGDNYYYSPTVKIKGFDILKYVGKSIFEDEQYPFIGIHGGFEILNGSRSYKDWVQKAKFMNISVLGICEKNTLAGALKFQLACKSKGIQPIIGAQYTIKDNEDYFTMRFYVINEEGWRNILLINTEVNVVNNRFVELDKLVELVNGLFIIIEPKTTDFEKGSKVYRKLKSCKERVFFQFDDTVYESDETDERFLTNVKKYLEGEMKPIFIPDAYYLDKDEFRAKDLLNTISDKRDFKSHNQYLKSIESAMLSVSGLFSSKDKYVDVCTEALTNLISVSDICTFNIAVRQRLLPNYTMTKEEQKLYANNEEMFMSLIELGIQNKLSHLSDVELKKYIDRVDLEWGVIVGNGYVDYFLILWDIIRWARENDILVGIGRGSAGGSLIAYLTDIIQIDPLEFDLLFERFLNEGRAKSSYPDIDTDFEASRRDDVKRYMEDRYGWENVCSVGTYTNLQLKQALKDVSKIHGIDYETVNYISEVFNLEDDKWSSLFTKAVEKATVKDFIKSHPEVIEDMQLIQGQPRSRSIHACATVITPNGKSVFESFPVRAEMKGDEIVIISEWEGGDLESAGYLKEDILGIKQLDKYRFILNLIKETTGEVVDIYKIPYDDKRVIELFQKGMNGDVFHLGSPGLTAYCVLMQPENINDLIAAIALFRPGAMDVNSHNEYVLRKHGERSVEYKFMMESITKKTYGLIVYQEQVMKVFQELADFTLTEADDIRRAIGKKKRDLIDSKKKLFVEKVISKGGQIEEAEEIWHEVEVHAGYSFNKCISGRERLYRPSSHKSGYRPTIKEMYDIKNDFSYAKRIGRKPLHMKYKKGYGVCYSLNENNRLIKNNIKDIRYEGERNIYRINLKNGASICVTENHKFPTSNGEKMLKDICVEKDLLFYNIGYEKADTAYRFTDKGINNPRYHNNKDVYQYELNSQKGKEGFQKRDTPYTKLNYYRHNLKKKYCEVCLREPVKLEIHHKDNNHANNEYENLLTICPSCHKKEHYKIGRVSVGQKGLLTTLVEIKSIEFEGKEDVYDVEMENPYHTFVTDKGIVTCNSHAAAYAITGYIGQWLKVHYPIQFWTSAFEFDDPTPKKSKINKYISEINKSSNSIKINPPDINQSTLTFAFNFEEQCIYWSISKVRGVGEKVIEEILSERDKNGRYFSIAEFIDRTNSRVINKTVVTNLILSGCFDIIEDVKKIEDRERLFQKFYKIRGIKEKDQLTLPTRKFEWQLKQKEMCGFGILDYKYIIMNFTEYSTNDFVSGFDLQNGEYVNKSVLIGGIITSITTRSTKKAGDYCVLELESNHDRIYVTLWNESFETVRGKLEVGKILMMEGVCINDTYRNEFAIHSNHNSTFIII